MTESKSDKNFLEFKEKQKELIARGKRVFGTNFDTWLTQIKYIDNLSIDNVSDIDKATAILDRIFPHIK